MGIMEKRDKNIACSADSVEAVIMKAWIMRTLLLQISSY
jgi:hypothetical protein